MAAFDGRLGRIEYNYPIFKDHIEPKGALSIRKETHACFYYVMLAMKARGLAGSGIDSQIIQYKVGDTAPAWMESRDEELARSTALIYGLESPDSFLDEDCKKRAWAQCIAIGVTPDEAVFRVRPGARKVH